ncbi:MAG: hypothetical protein IJM23_01860 [Lachnospiraceae bacterium]|nr:hypothetical protein [Lachnospiraceae bacterium]
MYHVLITERMVKRLLPELDRRKIEYSLEDAEEATFNGTATQRVINYDDFTEFNHGACLISELSADGIDDIWLDIS